MSATRAATTDLMAQAVAHHAHGRLSEAIRVYQAVLAAEPGHLEAYGNLAHAFIQLDRLPEAEPCWRAIVRLAPGLAAGHNNLGATLRSLGRPAEAAQAFSTALKLQPVYAEASNNLGTALCELGRFEDSIPCYIAALRANPNYPKGLCNLGSALRDLRRFDESLQCLSQALRLSPDFAEAHFNAAQLLLLTGRLGDGWPEFEWRAQLPKAVRRNFVAPAWRGGPTGDRVVLIHAEEGLGDTIQFCRFVPELTEAGHRVVLEVQPPLRRLLSALPGIDAIVAAGEALPPHDLQCPLLSLPLILGCTLETIPARPPYLGAADDAAARWGQRLAGLPGRRVGLAWAGNRDYAIDRRRSITLDRLAPLASAPGVAFISLQKGDAAREAAPAGLALHDWTDELTDMAETAALIASLDLVISVDTAVAHLAGALGKPVWLLNRFDSDWRWLLDREDSPWYPAMRIFRQSRPGDWDAPIMAVRDALVGAEAPFRPAPVVRTSVPMPGVADDWQRAATLDRLAAGAMRQGDFEVALAHSREAVRRRPDAPWLHNNLANASRALARLPEALAAYQEAERLAGKTAPTRINIGSVMRDLGRMEAAEAAYREALAIDPELAEAHTALGALLLETGRFEEGWPGYAWRTRNAIFQRRPFECPVWDGTPVPGKTVFLYSDEGLGDAIQFCRYVPRAAAIARVVLESPPPLAPLFAALPGPAHKIVQGDAPGPFDLCCPLLDLPRVFGTTLATIPAGTPYLHADLDKVAAWQGRLSALPGRRVGLVWSGNPANLADRDRSVPPRLLSPLVMGARDCSFISLQKHNNREGMSIPAAEGTLHDWTEELRDMGDTAALIMALDLVIGVDTAVAHLAGALHKPVWLLNRFSTDWRWQRGRADSPWYPSLQIFRQPRLGAWDPVIAETLAALNSLAGPDR
jgi:tetratricopeptide (TPR) repeat protein